MASTRAEEVAEILWELKRAQKVAKFSTIASRAGFSAGTQGKAMYTCLRAIRRDWPHLQWWRAVKDDGQLEKGSDQEAEFRKAGFDLQEVDGADDAVTVSALDDHLMEWDPEAEQEAENDAS